MEMEMRVRGNIELIVFRTSQVEGGGLLVQVTGGVWMLDGEDEEGGWSFLFQRKH